MATFHVAVIGAGALGQLFAALLSSTPGIECTLITRRPEAATAIQSRGIQVTDWTSTGAGRSKLHHPAVTLPEPARSLRGVRVVLVLTKSYEVDYALNVARTLAMERGMILLLQNGLQALDLTCAFRGNPATRFAAIRPPITVNPATPVWRQVR